MLVIKRLEELLCKLQICAVILQNPSSRVCELPFPISWLAVGRVTCCGLLANLCSALPPPPLEWLQADRRRFPLVFLAGRLASGFRYRRFFLLPGRNAVLGHWKSRSSTGWSEPAPAFSSRNAPGRARRSRFGSISFRRVSP